MDARPFHVGEMRIVDEAVFTMLGDYLEAVVLRGFQDVHHRPTNDAADGLPAFP